MKGVQHYKHSTAIVPTTVTFSSLESSKPWINYGLPITRFWDGNFCSFAQNPVLAYGYLQKPILGLPVLWFGTENGGVFKSDQGLFSLACERMLPSIRPANSLINSIYELKDLESIPKTLHKIGEALDALEKLYQNRNSALTLSQILKKLNPLQLKQALKGVLRSTVDATADSYLQSNFNIAPLLNDISTTFFKVQTVRDKLNKLISNARRKQRTHWGAPLSGFSNSNESFITTGRPTDFGGGIQFDRKTTYSIARFQATLEYSYEMPPGTYKDHLMRGLADFNGLTLSPRVIWNAIPWSFVVDWVVGIGPWLDQFTGRHLEIVTHVDQACWSVHVERNVQVGCALTGPVSQITEESYYRTPATVPLISSLRTNGLNLKEFSLGAALGITQRGRFRRVTN